MQLQARHGEDPSAVDLVFHRSSMAGMSSRRCDSVDRRSFTAVPPVSAFSSYHEQHGTEHRQRGCVDTSHGRDTRDVRDDDDDCNSRAADHGVEINRTMRCGRGSHERRGGFAVCHDLSAGSHCGPASQRKPDYSVAELLRNDRPSSRTTDDQTQAGTTDSHRHDAAETSPSQTTDSAFHSWNVEQVDRLTARLPLPLPFYTAHRHPWTERMLLDSSCRRADFDNQAQRRFFGLFDTPPPLNFLSTFRCDTAEHVPLSTHFGQESSTARRSRICTFRNWLSP